MRHFPAHCANLHPDGNIAHCSPAQHPQRMNAFDVRGVAGERQRCGFSPNHFDHLLFHIGSDGFSIYR